MEITTAVFEPESKYAKTTGLWQYDYGQILRLQGLDLPKAVEIHFSLSETGGESVTRIGTTKDGVTDVLIPDSMLENNDAISNYSIFVFIFLSDDSSGNTEYRIKIPVKVRPRPEVPGSSEEPELFRETIKEVNQAADRSEEARNQAEAWAHGREDYPELAEDNAKYYASQAADSAAESAKSSEDADKTKADVEKLAESIKQTGNDALKNIQDQEVVSKQNITSHTDDEINRINKNVGVAEEKLQGTIRSAGTMKQDLKESTSQAETMKNTVDKSVKDAEAAMIEAADSAKKDISKAAEKTKEEIIKKIASDENVEKINKNATNIDLLKEDIGNLQSDFDGIVSTNKIPIFDNDKITGTPSKFTAMSLLGNSIEIDNTSSYITGTVLFAHNVTKGKEYNISLNVILGSIYSFTVKSYSGVTLINESNVEGKQNYSFTMDNNSKIEIMVMVRYTCQTMKAVGCYLVESDSKTTILPGALPDIPEEKIPTVNASKVYNEYTDTNDSLYASKQLGMVHLYTNGLFDTKVKDGDYEVIGGALSETGSTRIGIEAKTGNKTLSYPRLTIYDKNGKIKAFDKIVCEAGSVSNPAVEKNILFVGDSLIAYKYFSKHFKNYLHDLGLTNFKLVGRVIDSTDADNKFEATGGYSWNNYVNDPSTLPSGHPNNWFWYNGKIDLNHYMETYCDGKVPDYIICNLGWNHKVNSNYSSDIDTIKSLCRTFLDSVHEQYPDCKIILNGIHHGMPNTFAYTLDYKKFAIELGHAYNAIAKETAYKNFVIYCDVAPYFDAAIGMQTKTRTAWGKEQTYVSDYVHPNEEGYKMHAFADVCAFLYLVS